MKCFSCQAGFAPWLDGEEEICLYCTETMDRRENEVKKDVGKDSLFFQEYGDSFEDIINYAQDTYGTKKLLDKDELLMLIYNVYVYQNGELDERKHQELNILRNAFVLKVPSTLASIDFGSKQWRAALVKGINKMVEKYGSSREQTDEVMNTYAYKLGGNGNLEETPKIPEPSLFEKQKNPINICHSCGIQYAPLTGNSGLICPYCDETLKKQKNNVKGRYEDFCENFNERDDKYRKNFYKYFHVYGSDLKAVIKFLSDTYGRDRLSDGQWLLTEIYNLYVYRQNDFDIVRHYELNVLRNAFVKKIPQELESVIPQKMLWKETLEEDTTFLTYEYQLEWDVVDEILNIYFAALCGEIDSWADFAWKLHNPTVDPHMVFARWSDGYYYPAIVLNVKKEYQHGDQVEVRYLDGEEVVVDWHQDIVTVQKTSASMEIEVDKGKLGYYYSCTVFGELDGVTQVMYEDGNRDFVVFEQLRARLC